MLSHMLRRLELTKVEFSKIVLGCAIMAFGVKILGDTGADKCLNMQDPAQQQACMEDTLGTAS